MSGSYAGFPYAGGAYAGALSPGASPPGDVGINLPTVTVSLDDGTGSFPYDITQYVEIGPDGGPIVIFRGRDDEYGDVQASTCSLVLNNTDGRFTLGSTSIASPSPIYVDNQIRVTFAVGAVSSTRFTGYVQNWPTAWPGGGDEYAVTSVMAVDRLARMSRRVLRSIVEEEILSSTPAAYYTLGEPAGATSAGDTSGNGASPLQSVGSGTAVTFGSATGPATDGLTGATFAGGKALRADIPRATPTAITIECFFAATAGTYLIDTYDTTGILHSVSLAFNGSVLRGLVQNTAGSPVLVDSPGAVDDGVLRHAAFVVQNGGPSRLYIDGVQVASDATSVTLDTFNVFSVGTQAAVVAGVPTGSIFHAAYTLSALSATEVADHAAAGLTAFVTDGSDDRIARYASYAKIATGDQSLETGVITNVPHLDITGMSPLAAIAAVNAAEQGAVFIRGDGKLVFQNRTHRSVQATDWSFAASPNLQGDVAFTTDMQNVINHVTASRINGTTQIVQNTASITKHEQYPTSLDSLLVATDAEALDLANLMVSTHAEPGARLPSATMDLMSNTTAFRQAWLGIELSDRITVTGLPSQAPASSVDLIVEGWTETLSATEWTATLNTTPFSLYAAWILGDATYGVLGSTTVLAA